MELDIFGSRGDWSAHGDYEPGVDPVLKPCPFCQSTDLICDNTHTPNYNVACEVCGAEGPRGTSALYEGNQIPTKKACEKMHRTAFRSAIDRWNGRRA